MGSQDRERLKDQTRTPRHIAAERWSDEITFHGEGPGWDPSAGVLRCVDLLAGDVVTFGSAANGGAPTRLHVARVAAAWRPRCAGGFVVAVERGFALVDPDGAVIRLGDLWVDPGIRMNDGGCDPAGRFYCGSMAYDATPEAGALWLLEPDGTTRMAMDGVTISNGLCWAPEGERAYYVDTATRRVDVLTFAGDGTVATRTPFLEVDPALGGPDGLTVDAEGAIWLALWGGGAVHRYLPDGTLDAVVGLDVPRPSACAFGGEGLGTLFVTTSRSGLDPAPPGSGAVYAASPGVVGLPLAAFGG